MHLAQPIYILDAIGPFFRAAPDGRINWSKIPFAHLEANGHVRRDLFPAIREDFRTVCEQAAAFGYNTISIDDLVHLHDHPSYPDDLRARIRDYQTEFAALFAIAQEYGLGVFVTTDIMFFHPSIEATCGDDPVKLRARMIEAIDDLFTRFPAVTGLITRIGESDGLDVEGDFLSRLTIRNPRQARQWIDALLPVFERHRRRWIFRTWSVGAYRVGDLIWNRDTLRDIFDGVESEWLVLSMKHGESDFFRHLPVSVHFHRGTLPRIVEIQARREYEGAGEYPSFIGPEVERFRDGLRHIPNMAGAMVWCQTGGWIRFRRLTFLEPAGVWNAINTWVAIRVLKDGYSSAVAIEGWRRRYAPRLDAARLKELLMLSSEVVTRLLYIEEFATKKVYFRRLRIPPLLAVFWDHVIINHSMRQVMRCFVSDGEAAVRTGHEAMNQLERMITLAEELDLRPENIVFMRDSFRILALAREYYFREFTPELAQRLQEARDVYRARHAHRYSIHLDFKPVPIKTARLRFYLKILFREQRGYRLIDRVFTIHILSWLYPVMKRMGVNFLPAFSQKQAMGIDSLFK